LSEETEAAGETRAPAGLPQEARPEIPCPEPDFEIDELRRLGQQQLLRLAAGEQPAEPATLRGCSRRELIAQLLMARSRRGRLGRERGVLQVRPEGFGFLRSIHHDYQNGPDDIYVSANQISRLRLGDGDEVVGTTRPPRGDEAYLALWRVERVNGLRVGELFQRVPFRDLTPVLPRRPLRLAHAGGHEVLALVELLAPMALGHRALIRLPGMFGGLDLLTALAEGVLENQPRACLLVLLVGERPEDNSELRRRLARRPDRGLGDPGRMEITASSFAEPPAMQAALSRFVLARARRLVEAHHDVVLIVDSLTRLVRAFNMEVPHSGKIIGPDLDAAAFHEPKALFASARSVEEGGSLTVLATLRQDREDCSSRTDQIIGEEFQDRANAEIVVHQDLCETHGDLGIDVFRTRTRWEDNPLGRDRQQRLRELRAGLAGLSAADALTRLRLGLAGSD